MGVTIHSQCHISFACLINDKYESVITTLSYYWIPSKYYYYYYEQKQNSLSAHPLALSQQSHGQNNINNNNNVHLSGTHQCPVHSHSILT